MLRGSSRSDAARWLRSAETRALAPLRVLAVRCRCFAHLVCAIGFCGAVVLCAAARPCPAYARLVSSRLVSS
eukprot:229135-Rhodomonas_salina.1